MLARALKQELGERCVEGQQHAVADELHEIQQRLFRLLAPGQLAGRDAVDQHAFGDLDLAPQGAFELLRIVDGAVFDGHRADGNDLVALEVQAGGFQIEHHHALFAQWHGARLERIGQLVQPLQLPGGEFGAARIEPEHVHS